MPVINPAPIRNGVIKEPLPGEVGFGANAGFMSDFVLYYGSVADDLPAWGTNPMARDKALRQFWPTEPKFAGALYTIIAKYAGFGYKVDGPKRIVDITTRMLKGVERGEGWRPMLIKFLIDVFTQDNGGFLEVIRADNTPVSPVLTLNHLDSARCVRTGRADVPVIYWDRWGAPHDMQWYQVIHYAEFPSPVEMMRGIGYCALSRCLRAAQVMRDVSIHKREKLSGRFNKGIWLVSGVTTRSINDALATHGAEASAQGLTRYMQPAVLGSLDPSAKVSAEYLALAGLPEGWSPDEELREYIITMALAFGADYQDFAPMMSRSGGGGGGGGSETLHAKGRVKGARLFMTTMEDVINYRGILPANVTFTFGDQDVAEDIDQEKLRVMRAEERAMRVKSGEISPEVARKLAVDSGDLDEKYLAELADYTAPVAAAGGGLSAGDGTGDSGASGDPSGDVQVGKPKTTNNRKVPLASAATGA